MIFNLNERKKHTIHILNLTEKIKEKLGLNNTYFGFFIIIIHILLVGLSILYLILGNVNKSYFIFILFWILLIFFNFYFNGCILTRIERHYLKDDTWYGPPTIPFLLVGYPISKKQANRIIYISSILITITILIKLFLY